MEDELEQRAADYLSSVLGFNGERIDPVLGGYHLGNGYRLYSPSLRRFTSPDSMSPFGKGGINPYAYCESDPINNTDPTGHHLGWLNVMDDMGEAALGFALDDPELDVEVFGNAAHEPLSVYINKETAKNPTKAEPTFAHSPRSVHSTPQTIPYAIKKPPSQPSPWTAEGKRIKFSTSGYRADGARFVEKYKAEIGYDATPISTLFEKGYHTRYDKVPFIPYDNASIERSMVNFKGFDQLPTSIADPKQDILSHLNSLFHDENTEIHRKNVLAEKVANDIVAREQQWGEEPVRPRL
ncbi:hypothetical protein PS870_03626 [Pseudomonas fluorescens]|uniref:RHS repeat-associated core domain-containing protein n=1 Tax=Pseudomonas fluorescens TaxID=294 RepID=A0A5E7M8A9_PSEFL|nr:RHS repeat-associated core domain-containing protein [Pseudomonas fluorescens]VVP17284.1 hypothetical protein PS870_03626 [Pseudomonas fluorescens]